MKLDIKDKKILQALDLNSRATLAEIAKDVKLSKQVIDYRIKNLMKDEVINRFYTVIDFSKLGYTQYKLYLKFQNVSVEKEAEITDFWIKEKNVVWVASCRGLWDLAVSILAKDVNEFGDILGHFMNRYGSQVLEKDVLMTQRSPVFTRNHTSKDKEKKRFVYSGKTEDVKLDEIDKRILKLLSQNARMPLLDVMTRSKLTRDVVSYRVKKLAKEGIISQYRTLSNLDKAGQRLYKIILRLHSLTSEKERQLEGFIESHPKGTQYLKLVGSWDCEMEFEVESEEELHSILLDIRNRFSAIIRDYNTITIVKEHKLDYFPF